MVFHYPIWVLALVLGLVAVALKKWSRLGDWFQAYQLFKVPEFNENMQDNYLYRKVSVYINSLVALEDSDFTNLFSGKKANEIVLALDPNQTVHDTFLGARVSWTNAHANSCRTFVLKIRKKDKRRILRPYLQHIHSVFDEFEQRKREVSLYMNGADGRWRSVPFSHPSTLETIAMDSDLKNRVKSDLESFLKSKQYYHRLGRVWKRSFLLYGPSGTGKSSFVAAMAKFLCYDVYDVDLSRVSDDSDLKLLLLQTRNKSVIVVEDLDRFVVDKTTTLSFSGVLNFMDGLLNSCCGDERVMVFTMNTKDHIDPAMLRPGRVDVHIYFPLCDFNAFKTLANSYLGVKDHKLFPQLEEIFQSGATLSPAEIGEIMIVNRSSPSRALKSVITALQINGDSRSPAKIGQRSADKPPRPAEEAGDQGGGFLCRESVHTVREFRKLYGFLRMKSSRKSGSFDLDSNQNER